MTSVFHWQFRRVLPTLSDPELRLIMALNSRSNVRNRCWPSTEQLMEDTGLSRPALIKARKGLISRRAVELVKYAQRVDDESELPPRQFVYQLTGKITVGAEVLLYLADNHSLGKGSSGEPSKVNAVNHQSGEPKVVTSLQDETTEVNTAISQPPKIEKTRAANPLFDAVALHVFGIQAGQVNGAGSRVGIIAAWLAGKSEKVGTRKIGFIPDPCTDPEQVRQFVAWYKRKLPGASVPRDLAKFSEYWLQWRSTNTGAALPKPFVNILEPLYELTKEEDERAWNGGGWKRDE